MNASAEQIRDQQKAIWNKFSPGWKKWDPFTMAFLRPMGDAIIAALDLKPNSAVLDIATGTGEPGLTIAAAHPTSTVIGTDLAEDMLAIAEAHARAAGLTNYRTQAADVSALPFPAASFDAISCRMGFMFFPEMQQAANEIARVLKPGGRFATSVWGAGDKNPWVLTMMGAIQRHVSLPPPVPGAPGMFRCAAPGDDRRLPARGRTGRDYGKGYSGTVDLRKRGSILDDDDGRRRAGGGRHEPGR